jgi:NitT/TauT family transport system substrate-binding protein
VNFQNILATTAVAVSLTAGSAVTAENLTMVRSSPWGMDSAQFTFGEELGYFAAEDINIDYVVAQGSLAAVQQVVGGHGDLGYLSPESLAVSFQDGNDPLPVVLTYNAYPKTVWEVVVLQDSPITDFAGLKGKTIGVGTNSSGNVPFTKAALNAAGFSDTDYQFLAVGFGPQAFHALTSGQIDALNLFHTMHESLASSGTAIRRLSYPEGFREVPSSSIFFGTDFVREKPDVVAGFGRALAKANLACKTNPEACARSLWRAMPELRVPGSEEKALKGAVATINVNFDHMLPDFVKPGEYGAFYPDSVRALLEAAKDGGLLASADIPDDNIFTNEFVSQYNDFDADEVIKRARAAE